MISLAGAPDLKRTNVKPFSLEPRFEENDIFGTLNARSSHENGHLDRSPTEKATEEKKSKKKKESKNAKETSKDTKKEAREKKSRRKKSTSEGGESPERKSPAYTPIASSPSQDRDAFDSRQWSPHASPTKSVLQRPPSPPSIINDSDDIEDEIAYDDDFEEEPIKEDSTASKKVGSEGDEEDDRPAAAAPKGRWEEDRIPSSSGLPLREKGKKPSSKNQSVSSFSESTSYHLDPSPASNNSNNHRRRQMDPGSYDSAEERSNRELALRELTLATKERELEHRERQRELEREIQELKLQQQLQSQALQLANAKLIASSGGVPASAFASDLQPPQQAKTPRRAILDYQALAAQRRRRRERERAIALKRKEEERAAYESFQRLAQDVREVFHELNLSVVSAEKERLMKDDRYRREREMKDQREATERAEKLQKELQERTEREEKWWQAITEREEKFATKMQARLQQEEMEREDRLRRDLEDRATRLRNERELHENLDKLEKERRAKNDEEGRHRESLLLQTQLTEMKTHYHEQTEELRHQMELDRAHGEELHKLEIAMMEKRHDAAMEKLQQQHGHQIAVVESYVNNSSKLEKLTTQIHEEMEASKRLHEKLTQERLDALREKEKLLEEQQSVLSFMMKDVAKSREELDSERARMASLAAKFDISVSQCSRNAEEDRRLFQEAFSRQETLRQQIEKDRKIMVSEIAHERKVLEQQHEEFLARKMEMINEVHSERSLLAKERLEANAARERQNREESSLLQSLHAREEEYRTKLASMEENYLKVQEMKTEQKQLLDEVALERDKLREERVKFEMEKQELLQQFNNLRIRAEEGGAIQERLRQQLLEERAATERQTFVSAATAVKENEPLPSYSSSPTASRFQIDLVNQRAILQKIKAR